MIDAIEGKVFDCVEQVPRERDQGSDEERGVRSATLLPPLSDDLVNERIWPLLHRKTNISLLWRLRRVNRSWRENVAKSLEWAALEIVRIDAPGLVRYLENRRECLPSLRERVEAELRSIVVMLSEDLADYVPRPEDVQAGAVELRGGRSSVEEAARLDWDSMRMSTPWPENEFFCSESENSEESGVDEAWNSSSEGSLRVYFPRHTMRV